MSPGLWGLKSQRNPVFASKEGPLKEPGCFNPTGVVSKREPLCWASMPAPGKQSSSNEHHHVHFPPCVVERRGDEPPHCREAKKAPQRSLRRRSMGYPTSAHS